MQITAVAVKWILDLVPFLLVIAPRQERKNERKKERKKKKKTVISLVKNRITLVIRNQPKVIHAWVEIAVRVERERKKGKKRKEKQRQSRSKRQHGRHGVGFTTGYERGAS